MSPRKLRLMEDRAMRDAAKMVVTTDVELIKQDMQSQGSGKSAAKTGSEYARLLSDGALDLAQENKGKLAGGVAVALMGLATWIFREPILDAIEGFLGDETGAEDAEPEATASVSEHE